MKWGKIPLFSVYIFKYLSKIPSILWDVQKVVCWIKMTVYAKK